MVIIDLASVNQRNPGAAEISVFLQRQHQVECCHQELHNPPQNAALVLGLGEILGGKALKFWVSSGWK